MDTSQPTNYWDYIRVEELLSLQTGLEADESRLTNDEVLFITVHQVFELWFKLMVRELRSMRDIFKVEPVSEQAMSGLVHGVRRVVVILQRCADHFAVVETLVTRDYLNFRDKLTPASGFQSAQMRQIEILMGLRDEQRIPLGAEESYMSALRAHDGSESAAYRRVAEALADRPTLAEACADWLYRTPIDGAGPDDRRAAERLDAFVEAYVASSAREIDKTAAISLSRSRDEPDRDRLRKRYEAEKENVARFLNPTAEEGGARVRRIRAAMIFILTYRELPLLAWPRELLDALIELEQAFLIFRQRHARMVERVIGRRTGTGGSAGVDYLDQTALAYRVFRDLWAVRALQIRAEAVPELAHAAFYGFRNG
jgi:tryptophan 2,3-dioxygenase